MSTLTEKQERLAVLEAEAEESGSREVELASEIDMLRIEIGRETGEGPFGCRTCGQDNVRVWYPVDEAQGIEITSYSREHGFEFEYDGNTDSGESGENESYWCRNCDDNAETLEELFGMPTPEGAKPAYEAEVYDSCGSVAIKSAETGQDLAHIVWTDRKTAADEFAEPDWRTLTDAERQQIVDVLCAAITKLTRAQVAS